jgi:putative SOS response-associated peptidase YedK
MAGVWKLWKNPKTNQWERTFAIITGEPNEFMLPINDRMTTFLEPRDYAEHLESVERPRSPTMTRMTTGRLRRSSPS